MVEVETGECVGEVVADDKGRGEGRGCRVLAGRVGGFRQAKRGNSSLVVASPTVDESDVVVRAPRVGSEVYHLEMGAQGRVPVSSSMMGKRQSSIRCTQVRGGGPRLLLQSDPHLYPPLGILSPRLERDDRVRVEIGGEEGEGRDGGGLGVAGRERSVVERTDGVPSGRSVVCHGSKEGECFGIVHSSPCGGDGAEGEVDDHGCDDVWRRSG